MFGFSVFPVARPKDDEEISMFETLIDAARFARSKVTETGRPFIIRSPKGTMKTIDLSHMGVS